VSSTTWTPRAVASEAARCRLQPWRAVEAQHIASTRRLVDSVAEQQALEEILEASKPQVEGGGLHYLLETPFRYPPWPRGSRFRSPADPGVFYAAEEPRTACAELGYWRWRFLMDSAGLGELGPSPQTLFQVKVHALAVDLREQPFARQAAKWTDRSSYTATQAFAAVARKAGMTAIRYQSVRDPGKGGCAAILERSAFAARSPLTQQTWLLTVTKSASTWQRDAEHFEFLWGR
jgi:RES domain